MKAPTLSDPAQGDSTPPRFYVLARNCTFYGAGGVWYNVERLALRFDTLSKRSWHRAELLTEQHGGKLFPAVNQEVQP